MRTTAANWVSLALAMGSAGSAAAQPSTQTTNVTIEAHIVKPQKLEATAQRIASSGD
jgi:hypothetical protein